MRVINQTNRKWHQFMDWSEFLNEVSQEPIGRHYSPSSARPKSQGSPNFHYEETYEDMLNVLHKGWPDGLEQARKLLATLEPQLQSLVKEKTFMYDVTGMDFDIALSIQGNPEPWITQVPSDRDDTAHEAGMIRLYYNCFHSHAVSKKQMIAKGVVTFCVVQLLEQMGYRVEITVGQAINCFGRKATVEHHILAKDFNQPLELDRLIFAFAHPDMLRRCLFRLDERVGDPQLNTAACNLYGTLATSEYKDQFDLYVQGTSSAYHDYMTDEDMVKQVLESLKTLNITIN
jgi:hypothetical protein